MREATLCGGSGRHVCRISGGFVCVRVTTYMRGFKRVLGGHVFGELNVLPLAHCHVLNDAPD